MQALLGSHRSLLEEVCLSGRLKYLVLVLKQGTTREQLEDIRPDYAAALAATTADDLVLTIVTARGEPGIRDCQQVNGFKGVGLHAPKAYPL